MSGDEFLDVDKLIKSEKYSEAYDFCKTNNIRNFKFARICFKLKKYHECKDVFQESENLIKFYWDDSTYIQSLFRLNMGEVAVDYLFKKISSVHAEEYKSNLVILYLSSLINLDANILCKLDEFFSLGYGELLFNVDSRKLVNIFKYFLRFNYALGINFIKGYIYKKNNIDKEIYRLYMQYLIDQKSSLDEIFDFACFSLKIKNDIFLLKLAFNYISPLSERLTRKIIEEALKIFDIEDLLKIKFNSGLFFSGLEKDFLKKYKVQEISFRKLLSLEYRSGEIGGFKLLYKISSKSAAYEWASAVGVKTPIYMNQHRLEDFECKENLVLKPVDGNQSKGVFIIFNEERIFDLAAGEYFSGCDELFKRSRNYQKNNSYKNSWITEHLLKNQGNLARDIKFYCCYGRAILALESDRNGEIVKRMWSDRSGEKVLTGKYNDVSYSGLTIPQSLYELAEDLSSKLPCPFMRIDFLLSDDGIYLGELTPVPGGYYEFNDYYDSLLGYELFAARNRLLNDLIDGKEFTEVKNVLSLKH